MQQAIISIIQEVLPNFWHSVEPYTFWGQTSLAIKIAAKDYLINGVQGQRPQAVSMRLSEQMELSVQVYGGCGGNWVYRNINPDNPKERFNAMASEKVPFRTPQKNEKAVLNAVRKFCENYRQILISHKEVLKYQDIVNYDKLLGLSSEPTQNTK